MKSFLIFSFALFLVVSSASAQINQGAQPTRQPSQSQSNDAPSSSRGDDDRQQLSSDLQQMKVLLNQMRANLAFVQTSPTPLKHQFELEVDAWQVIVRQMEQRLQKMERSEPAKPRN